jgi:hypothetical protein
MFIKRTHKLTLTTSALLLAIAPAASADDAAAAMAAMLQDPLANISAITSDSTASFKAGPDHDDEAYVASVEPVYSFNFPDRGFSIVARAQIPYMGIKPGTDLPRLADDGFPIDEDKGDKGREWGLGDITTQFFYAPMDQEGWKFGGGPVISWRTRSDNDLKGAGGGAGPAFVAVGEIGSLGVAAVFTHLQGFDGDFSNTALQPMAFYNLESISGAYVGYNNSVSYDHKNKSGEGNSWTIPLGLTAGRTLDMGGGHGLDIGLGAYGLPGFGRPEGGAKYQVKLALGWIFPR